MRCPSCLTLQCQIGRDRTERIKEVKAEDLRMIVLERDEEMHCPGEEKMRIREVQQTGKKEAWKRRVWVIEVHQFSV